MTWVLFKINWAIKSFFLLHSSRALVFTLGGGLCTRGVVWVVGGRGSREWRGWVLPCWLALAGSCSRQRRPCRPSPCVPSPPASQPTWPLPEITTTTSSVSTISTCLLPSSSSRQAEGNAQYQLHPSMPTAAKSSLTISMESFLLKHNRKNIWRWNVNQNITNNAGSNIL